MSTLVIVESPAKAQTLSRILGEGYQVEASYGHVRDLPESAAQIPARYKKEPWARLGVNVQGDFEPLYVIPNDKKKHIKRLKEALSKADELLLATDEDREGESISWHVVEILKPKVPVRRIVFHEITDEAIHAALASPRHRFPPGASPGESAHPRPALRLRVVTRSLEEGTERSVRRAGTERRCPPVCRQRARPPQVPLRQLLGRGSEFEKEGLGFTARLVRIGDHKVATGQDFDPDSGELKKSSRAIWIRNQEEVANLMAGWSEPWTVSSVEVKPLVRRPAPPFTTSSMQQEANRKLRFAARHTMRVAQRLYEGIDLDGDRVGLITYMRTDSVTLAERALQEAQGVIRSRYGDAYAQGPRRYKTKSKMAQEAHEAIRPTEISRTPDQLRQFLQPDELRLYELIWKRTVASQMADAHLQRTLVEITAPASDADAQGLFSATGTTIEFAGFLKVYVESSDDRKAEISDQETLLPALAEQEKLQPLNLEPKSRDTSPPPRYTEATLVKKLEAEGIGRPSTYASIIDTIQRRGYIVKQRNALIPTFTAFAVTELLEKHFGDLVDVHFTARMEQQLDEIAEGQLNWQQHLHGFYFGEADKGTVWRLRSPNRNPRSSFRGSRSESIRRAANPLSSGSVATARISSRTGTTVRSSPHPSPMTYRPPT